MALKVPSFGKKLAEIYKVWELPLDTVASASLMAEIEAADKTDYIAAMQNLSEGVRFSATAWLQSIVDESSGLVN